MLDEGCGAAFAGEGKVMAVFHSRGFRCWVDFEKFILFLHVLNQVISATNSLRNSPPPYGISFSSFMLNKAVKRHVLTLKKAPS